MATDRRTLNVEDDELALLIGQYALGQLTLGQTAERAGVSRWRMRDILDDAGVEIRLGPTDDEDAADEVETALFRN